MRTLARFSFVAGFAVLASCAHMGTHMPPPPHVPPKPCHAGTGGSICVVTVTVNGCKPVDIAAAPERAIVPPGLPGDVEWRLVGKGWKFTANGITFKVPDNPEFVNKRHTDQLFKWHNRRTQPNREHWYTIEVTDGSQTCKWDPSIMN